MAASALTALFIGRMPGPQDQGTYLIFAYICFLAVIVVLSVGGKVERSLELASFAIVIWIFVYLVAIAVFFVSFDRWAAMLTGFVSFGALPSGAGGAVNWALIGGFVAYSGAGGLGNTTITNWARDKGYGMGSIVGYIPSAVGGRTVKLSHVGTIFPITPENVARFKEWWRYLAVDQYGLWMIGCFVGMGLCVLIATTFIPAGTNITGLAVGAYQAEGLAKIGGPLLWYLTLLNGFWILWGTQLSISDAFVRTVTDMAWQGSSRVRNWRGGDVRAVYYTVLILFAAWGCIAMNIAQPLILILLGANAAGLIFLFTTIHTIYVNRKFLPKELRPAVWREAVLVLFFLFQAIFVYMSYTTEFAKWFKSMGWIS